MTHYPYEKALFSYSKTQKNVVVIVLDMFTGSHIPYLLEYFPQFKTQLDGFTLFSNAISSSNATEYTMPSIVGGEYYTIINQNKRKDNHKEAEINAYFNTAHAFIQSDFDVGFISYPNAASQKMQETSGVFWLEDTRHLRDFFLQNQADTTFKNAYIFDIARFLAFGLFKFVSDGSPRYAIYNNGNWFFKERKIDENGVIDNISPFYAFTHIRNTQSQKPTFKFIHTKMTHYPYGIYVGNGQCEYLTKKTILKNPEHFMPDKNSNFKNYSLMVRYQLEQHIDSFGC